MNGASSSAPKLDSERMALGTGGAGLFMDCGRLAAMLMQPAASGEKDAD